MSHRNADNLPQFPTFVPIDLRYKNAFESTIGDLYTYSDFNFNSLWTWNVSGHHQCSELNGNVVIALNDYRSGELVLSIIGTNNTDDALRKLFDYTHTHNLSPVLKFVPEIVLTSLSNPHDFSVTEDVDQHDYLFSMTDLSALAGRRFKSKRRAAKKCARNNEIKTHFDLLAHETRPAIKDVLTQWEDNKRIRKKKVESVGEFTAIDRMLDVLDQQDNVLLSTISHKESVVGFSIDELLPSKIVLSHYFKTTPVIYGISEFFNQSVATEFLRRGYETWNWEQDLGIESLRKMKLSHRPIGNLKKYQISYTNK